MNYYPPIPPQPKKTHRVRNFLLIAVASAASIAVIFAVAVSTADSTAPKTKSLSMPKTVGLTAEAAEQLLKQAGFINSPAVANGAGAPLDDTTGYIVTALSDDTAASGPYAKDDSISLTMTPTDPCAYDANIPSASPDCKLDPAVADPSNPYPEAPTPAPATAKVVYKVTGSHGAMVTYADPASPGSTEQDTSASVPWTKTFSIPYDTPEFEYVSAQNSGGGSISCSISVDGVVKVSHTSNGDYAVVTCSN